LKDLSIKNKGFHYFYINYFPQHQVEKAPFIKGISIKKVCLLFLVRKKILYLQKENLYLMKIGGNYG